MFWSVSHTNLTRVCCLCQENLCVFQLSTTAQVIFCPNKLVHCSTAVWGEISAPFAARLTRGAVPFSSRQNQSPALGCRCPARQNQRTTWWGKIRATFDRAKSVPKILLEYMYLNYHPQSVVYRRFTLTTPGNSASRPTLGRLSGPDR